MECNSERASFKRKERKDNEKRRKYLEGFWVHEEVRSGVRLFLPVEATEGRVPLTTQRGQSRSAL